MRIPTVFGIAALWLATGGGALAATDTGTAVGVTPAAVARDHSGARTLVVGSDVRLGERVVTGPTGEVQIVFDDDTHLVVGPRSSLLIEAYLLRRDHSVKRFTIDALAGGFRFITGNGPKNAYLIRTPAGTIGVRGTAFDFVVGERTIAVLFEGAIRMCAPSGRCVVLDRRCQVGATDSTSAGIVGPFQQERQNLRSLFRYVQRQNPLRADFRVNRAFTCLRPAIPPVITAGPLPNTGPGRPGRPTGGGGGGGGGGGVRPMGGITSSPPATVKAPSGGSSGGTPIP